MLGYFFSALFAELGEINIFSRKIKWRNFPFDVQFLILPQASKIEEKKTALDLIL